MEKVMQLKKPEEIHNLKAALKLREQNIRTDLVATMTDNDCGDVIWREVSTQHECHLENEQNPQVQKNLFFLLILMRGDPRVTAKELFTTRYII